MKWIKHMTMAPEDERLSSLLDELGPRGYGIWWLVLERIAFFHTPEDLEPKAVQYSVKKWARICHTSSGLFQKFVLVIQDLDLLVVEVEGKLISLKSLNVLNYRDNHTSNRQAKSKKLASHLQQNPPIDIDTELDIDIDKEEPPLPPASCGNDVDRLIAEIQLENTTVHNGSKRKPIESTVAEVLTEMKTTCQPKGILEMVFEMWRATCLAGSGSAKLNAERKKYIKARLKEGYKFFDLYLTCFGATLDKHYMGENDSGKRYASDMISVIRNGERVERFRNMAIDWYNRGGSIQPGDAPKDLTDLTAKRRALRLEKSNDDKLFGI